MRKQLNRNTRLLLYFLIGISCSLGFWPASAIAFDEHTATRIDAARVQQIVDDLKSRLGIHETVTVSIVDRNPLVVSVSPVAGGGFALSFEASFAERLGEDELAAAIAHDLGHVWIELHFPILQT